MELPKIRSYSRFCWILLISIVIWFLLFFTSIHSVMPVNGIRITEFEKKIKIATWFPQGWGFYSKNPREEQFMTFDISKKDIAANWPNSRSENWFGLKRFGRSQGIEAGLINSKIPRSHFQECRDEPLNCLEKSKIVFELENPTPEPTICGDIGIAFQQPIPWAWSNSRKKIEMPSKVVRVKVICSKK
ncbi:SdpA family antimicrobial peptide system protein [Baia soyae]|uniref:Antimicrobial peptide system SdpA family protein n=1 Tax=Baia soyae TaxID=1544746 RepID=A0A4R2RFT8_9BACL|nr:SdpA family antimicrobial peptide system protein [Baia soyae]TCP61544.1 antimicrobial peptide system SdpA family protein [Baia soyae]